MGGGALKKKCCKTFEQISFGCSLPKLRRRQKGTTGPYWNGGLPNIAGSLPVLTFKKKKKEALGQS